MSLRAVRRRGAEMNRKERRLFQSATRKSTWDETVQIAAEVAGKMVSPALSDFEKRLSDEIIAGLEGQPFYHGGLPGRQVGDYLLPARVTGEDPRGNKDELTNRVDHVFATARLDVAWSYADLAGGVVYKVEMEGVVGVDETELRMALLLLDSPRFQKEMRAHGKAQARAQIFGDVIAAVKCERARVLAVLD